MSSICIGRHSTEALDIFEDSQSFSTSNHRPNQSFLTSTSHARPLQPPLAKPAPYPHSSRSVVSKLTSSCIRWLSNWGCPATEATRPKTLFLTTGSTAVMSADVANISYASYPALKDDGLRNSEMICYISFRF